MVAPIVPLLVVASLAVAAGASRRRGGGTTSRSRSRTCALAPESVSLEDASEQDRWVRCAGRTRAEVETLAGRLTAASRVDRASRVIALFDRRRTIEDAPPHAADASSSTHAEVERTIAASDTDARSIPVDAPPETITQSEDAAPPPRAEHGASRSRGGSRLAHGVTTNYADPSRAAPHGYSAANAARYAPILAECVRTRTPSACRRRVRQFQTAAGIGVDGTYGTLTYWALSFWLGASGLAPQPTTALRTDARLVYVAPQHGAMPSGSSSSSPSPDELAQMGRDMTRHGHDAPPVSRSSSSSHAHR